MATNERDLADALGRAHKALLNDLRKLEEAVLPGSGEKLADVRSHLDKTRRHITDHFRFEEHNGYMEAVKKRQPHLERKIQLLVEEHRQLAHSLDGLVSKAQAATTVEPALCEAVHHWVEHLRQHETRENDLVLDAFNLDITAED